MVDNSRSRVLVWGLSNNRAGTEMVIYNYVKHAPSISFDFLCYDEPLSFSDLFEEGSPHRYFVIPVKIKHPFAYMRALNAFMREHGSEYSALWFNVNEISNIDLLIYAKRYGIERRITHMHNSEIPDVFITKLFSKLNWRRCLALTTDRWACSDSAGSFLYRGLPYTVIPNMVNAEGCAFSPTKRKDIRARWSFGGSLVIGTVGRLAHQKNHEFLLRLMPSVLEKCRNAKLMIVGDGPLREDLTHLADELGLGDHVVFTGSQPDVQAFLSAFDVYAFPSFYEGLSLSILEAQFNGLPCVMSSGVGEESVISSNVAVVSLDKPQKWVSALLDADRKENTLIVGKAEKYDLGHIDEVASALF